MTTRYRPDDSDYDQTVQQDTYRLTTATEIADALETAICWGEKTCGRRVLPSEMVAVYGLFIETMRSLAEDLRSGRATPLPVEWNTSLPWLSGTAVLREYGRSPRNSSARRIGGN